MNPMPLVMRIFFDAKLSLSLMNMSLCLDCFHKKQIRLYHLPIRQCVEVETCPVGNSAGICILQLRVTKAG